MTALYPRVCPRVQGGTPHTTPCWPQTPANVVMSTKLNQMELIWTAAVTNGERPKQKSRVAQSEGSFTWSCVFASCVLRHDWHLCRRQESTPTDYLRQAMCGTLGVMLNFDVTQLLLWSMMPQNRDAKHSSNKKLPWRWLHMELWQTPCILRFVGRRQNLTWCPMWCRWLAADNLWESIVKATNVWTQVSMMPQNA